MRKDHWAAIAIAGALVTAAPARADLYVGFGVGDATLREDVAATSDDLNAHAGGNSYYFGLGLGRHVRFELTRFDFDRFEDEVGPGGPTLRSVGFDADALSFVLSERIGSDLSLYLRAGWFEWDRREGLSHESGTDPLFGLGLSYRLGEHLTLRSEYLRADAGLQRIEVPTLSIAYHF